MPHVSYSAPSHYLHQYLVTVNFGPLGTNFSGILIKLQNFSFMKMHLKISSVKWQAFCPVRDDFKHIYLPARQRSPYKPPVSVSVTCASIWDNTVCLVSQKWGMLHPNSESPELQIIFVIISIWFSFFLKNYKVDFVHKVQFGGGVSKALLVYLLVRRGFFYFASFSTKKLPYLTSYM